MTRAWTSSQEKTFIRSSAWLRAISRIRGRNLVMFRSTFLAARGKGKVILAS